MGHYLKYNTFYQDTHHYRNLENLCKHSFRADHFTSDPQTDEFICPNKQRLIYLYTRKYTTENGYESEHHHYEGQTCQNCPLKSHCIKTKGNRRIQVSFQLLEYSRQARQYLTTETGKTLRKKRSVEVETVLGHIKQNMRFRRFHLRGLNKVKTERQLIYVAHDMRKLGI
ncbi:MAG: transposase [Chloroflexota bacterium]